MTHIPSTTTSAHPPNEHFPHVILEYGRVLGWDGIYCGYWCRHRSKVCSKAHGLPSKALRQFGQQGYSKEQTPPQLLLILQMKRGNGDEQLTSMNNWHQWQRGNHTIAQCRRSFNKVFHSSHLLLFWVMSSRTKNPLISCYLTHWTASQADIHLTSGYVRLC